MKKKLLALGLICCMVFSFAACGSDGGSEADGQKVYKLKVSFEDDQENYMVENWVEWLDVIKEKSGGRLDSEIYYNCTLLDATCEMQQLEAGIADISDAKRYANDGFVIGENWMLLTAGIPIDGQVSLSYDICEKIPEIMEEYSRVHVLAQSYTGNMPYELLTTTKEVRTPDDMKGLTLWCQPDWNEFVKACGATPINSPWSEVYSSLQKNMYDGLLIPVDTLKSCNFAEVCKNVTFIDILSLSGPGYYMNLDTYNSLPDDLKAIVDDEELRTKLETATFDDGLKLCDESMKWAEENYNTKSIQLTEEQRQAFIDKLTESKAVIAEKLDKQGLPGTKIVEQVADYSK